MVSPRPGKSVSSESHTPAAAGVARTASITAGDVIDICKGQDMGVMMTQLKAIAMHEPLKTARHRPSRIRD